MSDHPPSTNDDDTGAALLEAARALAPQIRAYADQIERDRQLPASLVDALAAAGLFRMPLPRELDGPGADPETFGRVIEEVARADGSAGWCVMVPATVAALAGSLPLDTARAIWGDDPRAYGAGTGAGPGGPAVAVAGGYRASGRWIPPSS